MKSSRPASFPIFALLCAPAASLTALAGCGAGTAAAVSGGGGSSGGNAPPSIAGFTVTEANNPHECRVQFTLRDPEGNAASVELLYEVPGSPAQLISSIAPVAGIPTPPSNPASLAASASGVLYAFQWDFASEALLPDDGGFVPGGRVFARLAGTSELLPGANTHAGIGNDPPVLTADDLPAEVSGVVPVLLHMSDSSSDAIQISVAYDIQGDDPDAGWRIARPAGLPPSAQTPQHAFDGITAAAQGSDIVFFWDTDFDLHGLERAVQLRVTPNDMVPVEGTPALTNLFRVDNNAAPILQLHEGALLTNPDAVRGIPVSFTLIDEGTDEITVVFQWRREGESFPELPHTAALIETILADEDQRRQYHVCSQYPRTAEGCAVWLDPTHVRLPELSGELSFLAAELVGRELEILRPTLNLSPVSAAWTSNPLVGPVAVLPLDGGVRALVLDESPGGTWTLARVQLLDGVLENTVAGGTGAPGALCFEHDEASVLVASSVGNAWQVTRVVLASGATTALANAADGPVEQGRVRGMASIGTHAAVLTVGGSLVRVDWSEPLAPRAVAVRTQLETPWGVVVDPRNAGWVLLAENTGPGPNGPGRVVALELATRTLLPVVILPNAADGLAFPRPRGIAVQRKGTRLLAVCETDPLAGRVELRGVELGRADASSASSLGQPLGAGTAALAAGAEDDLLLSTSASDRRVHAAGGVERRATIAEVDAGTATTTLASAFTPALAHEARWRVVLSDDGPFRVAPGDQQGLVQNFLWDSSEAPGGGDAFLRVTPLDTDIGPVTSSTGPKPVSPTFGEDALIVSSGGRQRAVVQADLDGDGDLDLVSANVASEKLTVFWQAAPGDFNSNPTTSLSGPTMVDPASVQAADLDGDGDLDLVSGNSGSHTLTVFWQTAPGTFDLTPITLSLPGPSGPPFITVLVVQAADLDGDGDLDLVASNFGSDSLAVFWQIAPGDFDRDPTSVGGPSTSESPVCVQAADLDGDGDLDLVSANFASDTLAVFWQTGSGSFDRAPTTLGGPTVDEPFFVQAADLDGDGDLDLVSANATSNTLTVFWQLAPGTFDPTPTTLGGSFATFQPLCVQAADLDGDGDLDLVCASSASFLLAVFWQTAPGIFDLTPTIVGGNSTTPFPHWVQAADLDGDGDLDLVSASMGGELIGSLAVFWQTAPGEFDTTPILLSGLFTDIHRPESVQAADLDGDGDLDLVSANSSTNNLTVFWQIAPGTFDPTLAEVGGPSTTLGAVSVQAADLDGDGDLDLVSANSGGNNLTVFWQTTPGVFNPDPTFLGGPLTTSTPRFVQAADLNGDGDLDLVCANSGFDSSNLTVFWQEPPGVFDSIPHTAVGGPSTTSSPVCVQAADVDGDGSLDLVSANYRGDNLAVFWQTAPRVFDSIPPTKVGGPSTTLRPQFVQAVDLDGDGDLDLVSANDNGNNLRVFWQTAPRTFVPALTPLGGPSTTIRPHCVQAADLDGDGDLDLVSANYFGNTLTVFRQTAPSIFDPTPTTLGGLSTTARPSSVQVVDLDGDGDLDLVSANWLSSTLTVFRRLH